MTEKKSDYIPTEEEVENYLKSKGLSNEQWSLDDEEGFGKQLCSFCLKETSDLMEAAGADICRSCAEIVTDYFKERKER